MMEAELYTIHLSDGMALSFMPHPRGYDWLPEEMASYHAQGVRVVASLLTEAEIWLSGLMDEMEASAAAGMHFIAFPITDRGVPPFAEPTFTFIQTLAAEVRARNHVAIHCWAGIGRSALIAASVLVTLGIDPLTALQTLSQVRGIEIPDTPEQAAWVARFAREYAASS
jgi:predicted protein tyrosine phosphatase